MYTRKIAQCTMLIIKYQRKVCFEMYMHKPWIFFLVFFSIQRRLRMNYRTNEILKAYTVNIYTINTKLVGRTSVLE